MTESADQLLRPKEAAAILDVACDTLTQWAEKGLIPFVRVGKGMRRYYRSDVERLLQAHTQAAS